MRIGEEIGLALGPETRTAFGEALRELGGERATLVVVDADVGNSTKTELFGAAYPERFFQVGIAESNLIGVAGGLASCGLTSVAASFAAFLTCNSYDQIRMSVAFPRMNVKLVGSHAGISIGEDGPSQMGIEDLALMTSLPGFTVLAPADAASTRTLTRRMVETEGPFYMRTGRPKVPIVYPDGAPDLEIGRAQKLREGTDVTLIACGLMVAASLEAAARLAADGIEARVLDLHTVKPVDVEAVTAAARETGAIVTAEEHLLNGGLGAAVAYTVARAHPCPIRFVGLDNLYAESGRPQELLDKYGLNAATIARRAREAIEAKA
jgi:transketolase